MKWAPQVETVNDVNASNDITPHVDEIPWTLTCDILWETLRPHKALSFSEVR